MFVKFESRTNWEQYTGFHATVISGHFDSLSIHNGGSDDSERVAILAGQMNDTIISISGNQMFLVFKTNHEIVSKGFHALIMESKSFDQNK